MNEKINEWVNEWMNESPASVAVGTNPARASFTLSGINKNELINYLINWLIIEARIFELMNE